MQKVQWLIPTFRIRDDWKRTQADDDREAQLQKAEEQRRRRAEKNLKVLKAAR
jgi:hypothetical protein